MPAGLSASGGTEGYLHPLMSFLHHLLFQILLYSDYDSHWKLVHFPTYSSQCAAYFKISRQPWVPGKYLCEVRYTRAVKNAYPIDQSVSSYHQNVFSNIAEQYQTRSKSRDFTMSIEFHFWWYLRICLIMEASHLHCTPHNSQVKYSLVWANFKCSFR